MIYIISILSILVVVLGFTTFNLLRKVEQGEDELKRRQDAIISYQEYVNGLGSTVEFMNKRIKEIDAKVKQQVVVITLLIVSIVPQST